MLYEKSILAEIDKSYRLWYDNYIESAGTKRVHVD